MNIFEAILFNKYQLVKDYLNNGGDVHAVSERDGNNLILLSLDSLPESRIRITKLLLKHGARMPSHREVHKSDVLLSARGWEFIHYYESLCK